MSTSAAIGEVRWIGVPAAIAIAMRPVALLPAVALVSVTTVLVPRWTWRRRAALWGPLALAGIGVVAWNAWVQLEFDDPRVAEDAGFGGAIGRSLKDIPRTLRESVGSLSWQELSAPWPGMVLWACVAIALAVTTWFAGSPRLRVALALWLVTLLLGPVAFETLFADRIGFIWQGRYSISTLVGLGALAAFATRADPRPGALLAPALLVTAAVAEVAAFWAMLRRSTTGTNGSWSLADMRGWDPALDPRLLLVVHVVVVAIGVVALTRAVGQPTK